jgi:hypothetical protein
VTTTSGVSVRVCQHCGEEFTPTRMNDGRGWYCGVECRNAGNQLTVRPWVEPAPGRGMRKRPMTDEEFRAALARERWKLDNAEQVPGDTHWRKAASDE